MALALQGCSPSQAATRDAGPADGPGPCSLGFLGDPSKPPAFDFQVLHPDGTTVPIHDGDSVPMIFPPQGGRVIFVGVRATNVDPCALQLTGALRDEATQEVRLDSRTINLTPEGDGWGASATSTESVSAAIPSFSNVPVCPNEWSSTDLYGNVYGLEVTIKDRGGRMLTQKIQVTPECGEPDNLAECLCICKAGYVLGETCAGDAGDGGGG